MTKHERMILDKLTEDPMLSQGELATMLNLTRSSVSVYISHLMQMGYIRGRGYLIEDNSTIFIIGTASIDNYTSVDEAQLYDPAHTAVLDNNELTVYYGGIAKNLSDNLCRIGHAVSCICAVGSDVQGRELLEECRQSGIDISDCLIVPGAKSSTYLEIQGKDNTHILLSSANMRLQERLSQEFLQGKSSKLRHARAIITEDSLTPSTLRYISATYSPLLVCSKVTRISRYMGFMNQFRAVVASVDIAWLVLGEQGKAPTDDTSVFEITARIANRVNGQVLICYGHSDFAFSDGNRTILCTYSSPLNKASVYAHYRDAVAAGFFHCILEGIEGEDLLRYVSACRDIVAASQFVVNAQLCGELISAVSDTKHFDFRYK